MMKLFNGSTKLSFAPNSIILFPRLNFFLTLEAYESDGYTPNLLTRNELMFLSANHGVIYLTL